MINQKLIGRYLFPTRASATANRRFAERALWFRMCWEQVAAGMAWETIAGEWRGDVPKEAIAEAVRLASQAFAEHADEYSLELAAA